MAQDEFMKPDVLSGVLLLAMFAVMFFFLILTGVFAFLGGMH
jgi:hypothetical protein